MVVEVEETPPDDPFYEGFVTPCIVCHNGLVLVLPNYQKDGYSSCSNQQCTLHTANGPQV